MNFCFAKRTELFWWGKEVYLEAGEIAEYRINLDNNFNKTKSELDIEGKISRVCKLAGITAPEFTIEIHTCVENLISELEHWETKGKAIVIKVPNDIYGWSISENPTPEPQSVVEPEISQIAKEIIRSVSPGGTSKEITRSEFPGGYIEELIRSVSPGGTCTETTQSEFKIPKCESAAAATQILTVAATTVGGTNFWNPIGWTALGIAAIGATILGVNAINEHNKKAIEETAKKNEAKASSDKTNTSKASETSTTNTVKSNAQPATTTYTVKKGDSPWTIAQKFDTTSDAIMKAAGITDPTKLPAGKELKIVKGGGSSSGNSKKPKKPEQKNKKSTNLKKINGNKEANKAAKKAGYKGAKAAEALKADFVKNGANFNMMKDTKTGEIILQSIKDSSVQIPTGLFI